MLSELQKQLNGVVYTIKACMQSPTRSNLNCVQVDRTEARLAQHLLISYACYAILWRNVKLVQKTHIKGLVHPKM